MAILKFLLFVILPCYLLSSNTAARSQPSSGQKQNLTTRLQMDIGAIQCWDSLLELRACTGKVILFFLKGEAYLGPNCCRAIHVIENHCWPTMLGALGFTSKEGNVLRGYCDASETNIQPPPPTPSAAAALGPSLAPDAADASRF